MKKLFFLILFSSFLFAANILDISTKQSESGFSIVVTTDSAVDLMDQKIEQNQIIVVMQNSTTKKPYIFTPASDLISSIRVNQDGTKVVIHIVPKKALDLQKHTAGNKIVLDLKEATTPNKANTLAGKLSSNSLDLDISYLYMFLFISVLLFLLIIVKLVGGKSGSSWLFGKNKVDSFEIIQQKAIDNKNRLIVVRFKGMNYILLVGQSALLIDHYEDGKDLVTNDFEKLLKDSGTKLTDFMKR